MSKIDRSSLLQFLYEPRLVREVAEHFGIPEKLARLNLREAVESGQVLISKKPFLQTLKNSNGKLRRIKQSLYVSRKSPTLVDGWERFKLKTKNGLFSESKSDSFSIRFPSWNDCVLAKDMVNHKLLVFSRPASEGKPGSAMDGRNYKTKVILASEFDVSSAKVKMASHRTLDQVLRGRPTSPRDRVDSLLHVERIRLFQTLFKKPSTFLDLHGRFGVSRQIVKGLVKNGLIAETWAPKGIGVRFKLTRKGKTYLKELEAAAECEPKLTEKAFVRLKQKIFF